MKVVEEEAMAMTPPLAACCCRVFLLSLVARVIVAAAGNSAVPEGYCAPGCREAFVGDRNCDRECYNEACRWDADDCKDKAELRRVVVMGEFYRHVDHIEYHAVGPDGEAKPISIAAGRKWEGIDTTGEGEAPDWRELINAPPIDELEGPLEEKVDDPDRHRYEAPVSMEELEAPEQDFLNLHF
eukprot:jgi/Chlat1/155/Chrsp1S03237